MYLLNTSFWLNFFLKNLSLYETLRRSLWLIEMELFWSILIPVDNKKV